MSGFSTKGRVVEEKEFVSQYLKPGIHVAKITQVESVKSTSKGTPGVKFYFEGKPQKELDGKGQTADHTYWMTPKTEEAILDRFIIISDKLGLRDKLDMGTKDLPDGDHEALAKALSGIFSGSAARWKFKGVEIEGKMSDTGEKKNNWFKSELAFYKFVEELAVPSEDSTLKFDENNVRDMVRLQPTDTETSSNGSATASATDADAAWD